MSLAVVSGGTKGIGRAIIERFAQSGFNVAFFARGIGEVERFLSELRNTYPAQKFLGTAADAGMKNDVLNFGQSVLSEMGTPDVLVNNAGKFLPGYINKETEGTFETLWQVNVASAYYLTRVFYDKMTGRGSGHIFNICSIASLAAYPAGGSYTITKFALLGLSRELREELKPSGVRVTAVLPGAVLTDSWAGTHLPADRFISPKAVAESIYACYALPGAAVVEELLIRPQLGDI